MNTHPLIYANFHISVWISILGGLVALNAPDLIIPDDEGFQGPLRNNLLIAIGYLLVGQIGLWLFRYLRESRLEAAVMAYTFIATAAGAKFYGAINGLPISNVFLGILLYCGISHGLYYFAGKNRAGESASSRPHDASPPV